MKQETKNLTKYVITGVTVGCLYIGLFFSAELLFLVYIYNPLLEEPNDIEATIQTIIILGIPMGSGMFVGQKTNDYLSKKYHYDNDTVETKGNAE